MPIIRVNGFSQEDLDQWKKRLRIALKKAAAGVEELGITQDDVEPLFPIEQKPSAPEIIVEVLELWEKPERTKEVQDKLANALATAVLAHSPAQKVCCFVDKLFDQQRQGFAMKSRE